MMDTENYEEENYPRKGGAWLSDIFGGFKRLEPELGNCPTCGKEDVEFEVYQLDNGTIKKYAHCPDCDAKLAEKREQAEEVARLAEAAKVRRKCRESSGIPPKFMDSDFSAFEKGWQDKALKLCIDYSEEFPIDRYPKGYRSLYLWSTESWGVGKTHLSAAICHRIYDRWKGQMVKGDYGFEVQSSCPRIIFLSEPELFDQIQNTYSFDKHEQQIRESESDIIKRIVYADLFVLDDVGKEVRQKPDFVRKTLFKIINGRYDKELPIIITANLEPAQLHEHLDGYPGEASFGRFYDEMCRGKSIRMDGKSFRRSKGNI